MATNEEVIAAIYDCYEKLVAHEVQVDGVGLPTLVSTCADLHASMKAARDLAVEHFGIEPDQNRSGGGDKDPKDPNAPDPQDP